MPTHRATRDTWDQVLARITRNGERVVAVVSPEAGVYDVLTEDVPRVESRGVSDGYVKGDRGFDVRHGVQVPVPSTPNPGVTERRP